MAASAVLKKLDSLMSVTGKLDKQALLGKFLNDPEFAKVVQYALNPFQRFFMTSDHVQGAGTNDEIPFALLDRMARREVTRAEVTNWKSTASYGAVEVFHRIIDKDLRCGVADKTVNAVRELIPTFECQLAQKLVEKNITYPCYVSPKLDGLRCLVFVQGGEVSFYSRNGLEFDSLNHLAEQFITLANGRDMVYDGEAISGTFLHSVSAIRTKGKPALDATIHVFDGMSLEDFKSQNGTDGYHARYSKLQNAWVNGPNVNLLPHYQVNSLEEIMTHYQNFRDMDLEGAIVKLHDSLYRFGRTKDWMKIKASETHDLEVTGFVEGQGKYTGTLGALVVDFRGVPVNVGTGLSDDLREFLWHRRQQYLHTVIEVEAHEITPDGSLRHPRFIRFREDK